MQRSRSSATAFLGVCSALDGLVTAFSAGDSASDAGKSMFYARVIFTLLPLLLMSRLLRGQVFLLVRLEVLAPCIGNFDFVSGFVFWFLYDIVFVCMCCRPV